MIINDLDGYYIVFDTKNWNTELDTLSYLSNRLWALGDSLEHARYLPNKRIELPTIDERMRLISNMMDWEKYLPPVSIEK